MQHPDEGTIHAWLDGALSSEEGAAIETHAATCAECSAAIAEARGLVAASSRIVSALDIVPGGVIPVRKPVARPWYASTQLRAAAAVLFVAGASMLLLRDGGEKSVADLSRQVMSDAVSQSTAAVTAPAPESVVTQQEAAKAAPAPAREQRFDKTKSTDEKSAGSDGRAANRETRRPDAVAAAGAAAAVAVADAAVSAPPTVAAPQAPVASIGPATVGKMQEAPRLSRDTAARRTFAAGELSNVVVTGVATEADRAESLSLVTADTTAGRTMTKFRTSSGAVVTLTEESIPAAAESRRLSAAARPATPSTAQRSEVAADSLAVSTITWVDTAQKRRFVLSGRLTRAELEVIRKKIEASKR